VIEACAMAVHVSIHDVSPAFEPEVERLLELCHAIGARPALLVVPDYHGRAPLGDAPAFVDRLRGLADSGHEILLHGFYHRAEAAADPSGAATRFFRQKVVSAGEAEFASLPAAEAARRLDDGARVLRDAGLVPTGFVPPAWSMGPGVLELLASRGHAYTEDHLFVYDPTRKKRRPSVVLNFASRTPGRMLSTVAWCRLAKHARAALPARVALHPGDLRYKLLIDETRRLLAWAEDDLVDRGQALVA